MADTTESATTRIRECALPNEVLELRAAEYRRRGTEGNRNCTPESVQLKAIETAEVYEELLDRRGVQPAIDWVSLDTNAANVAQKNYNEMGLEFMPGNPGILILTEESLIDIMRTMFRRGYHQRAEEKL